jgi:hypothetical protein
MTDQGAHVATDQETALYEAMTAGDWDTVEEMRQEAAEADPAPPDPVPDDWLPPVDQYEVDYANAYAHYQADHEMPEEQREENTAEQVTDENQGRA